MSHHIDDGRVWAVDKRDGSKRRVMPHIIKYSKHLSLAPSERAKGVSITEPKRPKKKPKQQDITEPAPSSEPDNSQPVTEPGPTPTPETKE